MFTSLNEVSGSKGKLGLIGANVCMVYITQHVSEVPDGGARRNVQPIAVSPAAYLSYVTHRAPMNGVDSSDSGVRRIDVLNEAIIDLFVKIYQGSRTTVRAEVR